jgi:FkbM family methyltransferase
MSRIQYYRQEWRAVGLLNWPFFKLKSWYLRTAPFGKVVKFKVRPLMRPIEVRAGTSDFLVMYQVLIEREYACCDDLRDPRLILDCGANIGVTSAYFLSRFPYAQVISVEPDSNSFRQLEANLKPYGSRSIRVQAGVWSHATGLTVEPGTAGNEWGFVVRESKTGETPDVNAVDIDGLLAKSDKGRIDILKVDIEGSEREVFSRNTHSWIDKFDNLVIELHGDECTAIVKDAVKHRNLALSYSGELTVFRTQGA